MKIPESKADQYYITGAAPLDFIAADHEARLRALINDEDFIHLAKEIRDKDWREDERVISYLRSKAVK